MLLGANVLRKMETEDLSCWERRYEGELVFALFLKNDAKSKSKFAGQGRKKKAPREEGRYQQGPGPLDGISMPC